MTPQPTRQTSVLLLMVALAVSVAWTSCLAAGSEPRRPDGGGATLAIRRSYTRINARAARCRRFKKELRGYSLEGGELVAFFDGGTLLKLELTFYGEIYRATEEYYYVNDHLIFLYQVKERYDRTLSGKVVGTEKSRGYFRGGALLAWIDADGKAVPLGSDRFQEKAREGLHYSDEFSRGARSPELELQASHYR